MKVKGAIASTSCVDLRLKVRSPFGKDDLGGAVDLRVKVCSPLGGHKQGVTGTSRSSSRGRGGGRSCRGGVEEAAETRLNNLWGGGGSMIREKSFKRQKRHRVVNKDKKLVKRK